MMDFHDMSENDYGEGLREERVRGRSGGAGVEQYLRGAVIYERSRSAELVTALREIVGAVGLPAVELRARAEEALRRALQLARAHDDL